MNEETFKDRVKRLKKVGGVIKELEPEIRLEAFQLLKGYVGGGAVPPERGKRRGAEESPRTQSTWGEFLSEREYGTPAYNVKLTTAYLYSQYGRASFTPEEVRRLADDGGLIVSGRVDKTLSQASHKKKKLYERTGRGKFRPTVPGETYLTETFGVSKGRKAKPNEEATG